MDYSFFNKYLRAANYLTAAQIFLQDNFLLERKLEFDDIKPRLLGHWGSGPGVNFAYAHLSYLAKKQNQEMMFVLGPGHAFPALQANLFLEGTLEDYYPDAKQNYDGISYLCRNFSWPYGFPSHSSPGTPGVILEGGELGYSLSTAYGAALDNPDLIVACLVGDGEAETGAAAASWHLNKIVDPRTNGVVLPILHLNGYKISGPTIFGRMSDDELISLFTGYGYTPHIVSGSNDDIHQNMQKTLKESYSQIQKIKQDTSDATPKIPMIILRTDKGWTGVKELKGQKIEGNCLSHQVVLTDAKTDAEQLSALEQWLQSYNINQLFSQKDGFGSYVSEVLPEDNLKMGATKHALGGEGVYSPLRLPKPESFSEDASAPGTIGSSSMRRLGLYLSEVFKLNNDTKNFRFMSPDETYSNKLDEIFKNTSRGWVWPIEEWDKDLSRDGRALDMLSEHNLQGLAQGYILTGRHAVFASYEAFIQVVASMMDQYAKFLNQAKDISWRGVVPSLNYILTSSGWRQDHNGFSHQNPGFIDGVLRRQGDFVSVYFPPDGNTSLVVLDHCLSSTQKINVIVAGKTLEPRWLTPELAKRQLEQGLMIWDFASDENPDIVLAAAGDYPTKESLVALSIVKEFFPESRLRFVNILSLTSCGFGQDNTCLTPEAFNQFFTADKPVICNFHGYPETLKSIIFDYIVTSPQRFNIRGYIENGSTTTPFDMHVRNETSRYHIAIEAIDHLISQERVPFKEGSEAIQLLEQKIVDNTEYIKKHGVDMPEIEEWTWQN